MTGIPEDIFKKYRREEEGNRYSGNIGTLGVTPFRHIRLEYFDNQDRDMFKFDKHIDDKAENFIKNWRKVFDKDYKNIDVNNLEILPSKSTISSLYPSITEIYSRLINKNDSFSLEDQYFTEIGKMDQSEFDTIERIEKVETFSEDYKTYAKNRSRKIKNLENHTRKSIEEMIREGLKSHSSPLELVIENLHRDKRYQVMAEKILNKLLFSKIENIDSSPFTYSVIRYNPDGSFSIELSDSFSSTPIGISDAFHEFAHARYGSFDIYKIFESFDIWSIEEKKLFNVLEDVRIDNKIKKMENMNNFERRVILDLFKSKNNFERFYDLCSVLLWYFNLEESFYTHSSLEDVVKEKRNLISTLIASGSCGKEFYKIHEFFHPLEYLVERMYYLKGANNELFEDLVHEVREKLCYTEYDSNKKLAEEMFDLIKKIEEWFEKPLSILDIVSRDIIKFNRKGEYSGYGRIKETRKNGLSPEEKSLAEEFRISINEALSKNYGFHGKRIDTEEYIKMLAGIPAKPFVRKSPQQRRIHFLVDRSKSMFERNGNGKRRIDYVSSAAVSLFDAIKRSGYFKSGKVIVYSDYPKEIDPKELKELNMGKYSDEGSAIKEVMDSSKQGDILLIFSDGKPTEDPREVYKEAARKGIKIAYFAFDKTEYTEYLKGKKNVSLFYVEHPKDIGKYMRVLIETTE